MLGLKQIESRVEKLLREHGITGPPVPVEKLARNLGATIRKEPYDGDLSGALYRKSGLCVIGINKNDNYLRQRFTVAHEVGHLLLHDKPVFIDRHYTGELPIGVDEEQARKYQRDSMSSQAVDPMEIEANRFAASLLMPDRFVEEDLREMNIAVPIRSLEAIKPLANRYKVSLEAMIFRLVNLGVPVEAT